MLTYKEWKLIRESIFPLGVSNPQVVGGPIGSKFYEYDAEDEDEDEDEDSDDAEDSSDEGDEEGPDMAFPPDESEEMDGLPTPGKEKLQGDEDEDELDLRGIDPALLGDEFADEEGGEGGPGMGGPEGEMGDEMGGDMGGLEDLAMGGDEMGDEMGGMGGDEMGGDMGGLEDLVGDDMGGEGDLAGDVSVDGEEGLDDMGGLESPEDEIDDEVDMEEEDVPLFKKYMQTKYSKKYCMKHSNKFMGSGQAPMAASTGMSTAKAVPEMSYSKKYMDSGKGRYDLGVKKMCGQAQCEAELAPYETEDQFLNCLKSQAKGDVGKKWYDGLALEDALLPANDPNEHLQKQPQPGEVGFAPQGRVGSFGGYAESRKR